MNPADGEHEDRYGRDRRSLHEALDAERRAIEEFGAELERTGEAIDRVHRAWEAGFRESMVRLDQVQARVDEAVRLTRVLVGRRLAPQSART